MTASGLLWSYPLDHHVISTPAIYRGLVFIPDFGRKMHCLEADTGATVWTRDIQGEVYSSALVADGKVYVGTRSGQLSVFSATAKAKCSPPSRWAVPSAALRPPPTVFYTSPPPTVSTPWPIHRGLSVPALPYGPTYVASFQLCRICSGVSPFSRNERRLAASSLLARRTPAAFFTRGQ